MKKILFIAPHFVPSHLTGMHRTRLLVKHLRSFGWDPIVLTVHERHYEGKVDQSLTTLLDHHLRIEKDGGPIIKLTYDSRKDRNTGRPAGRPKGQGRGKRRGKPINASENNVPEMSVNDMPESWAALFVTK